MLLDVVDEAVGAGVVAGGGRGPPQLGLDDLSQLLAQLHSTRQHKKTKFELFTIQDQVRTIIYLPPLVVGVDVPDGTLSEDLLLVQS